MLLLKFVFIFIFNFFYAIYSHDYNVQNNKIGKIYWKPGKLAFDCLLDTTTTINEAFSPLDEEIFVQTLLIYKCHFRPIPLIDTLKELNINANNIEILWLSGIMLKDFGNFTKGLNIHTLSLEAMEVNDFENVNEDFFSHLGRLTDVVLLASNLPSLPAITHPYNLTLSRSWVENWDDCLYLEKLIFKNIVNITRNFNINCPNLKKLAITSCSETRQMLINGTRSSIENLTALSLVNDKLLSVPVDLLKVPKKLTFLNLAYNYLNDESFENFPNLENLEQLILDGNSIQGFALTKLMIHLPKLGILLLGRNKELKCNQTSSWNLRSFSEQSSSLLYLSMADTEIEISCFKGLFFPSLLQLDLSVKYFDLHNSIFNLNRKLYFTLQDLPKTTSEYLTVNLTGQNLSFRFGFKEYSTLSRTGSFAEIWGNASLTLFLDNMKCDCEHYWLARALIEFPNQLRIPDIRCTTLHLAYRIFKSFKRMKCVNGSFKYYLTVNDWSKGVIVDVHDSTDDVWEKVANLQYNISTLNLSGNGNITLVDSHLPQTLLMLDLQNNNLSLGMKEMEILFSVPERSVWLSGNLFTCDCQNKPLLDILYQHQNQVMDFTKLRCQDDDHTPVYLVSLEICSLLYPLAFGGTSLFFALLATLLLWRYKQQVKMYLYYHGWNFACIHEDDIDKDRPYDAFLSFAHDDNEYVMQNLLPKLENEPYTFRICVHYRDWVVGDWIPRQVSRSVRLSKRTIIVLSRNFVTSMWGYLEFRYAVADAMPKGQSRLIVLVLDDVLNDHLNEEMRGYLSTNTYMLCQDPWFWQKLNFAMPHINFSRNHESCEVTSEPSLEIAL